MDALWRNGELRALARYASTVAALYLVLALVIYGFWFHFADRPMAPIPTVAVAHLTQSTDPDQLRKAALALVKQHDLLVQHFDEMISWAIILAIVLCLGSAAVVGDFVRRTRRAQREGDV
jgi:hypothetical protein